MQVKIQEDFCSIESVKYIIDSCARVSLSLSLSLDSLVGHLHVNTQMYLSIFLGYHKWQNQWCWPFYLLNDPLLLQLFKLC